MSLKLLLYNVALEELLCRFFKPNISQSIQQQEVIYKITRNVGQTQRDGRPAEHRRRPLVNAAKFG